MSSHLAISYNSQTPAATPTAASGLTGAGATDNPLGFLAALIDQLTSGATTSGDPPATTDAAATPPVAPAFLALDTTSGAATSPQGASLLATLSKELDALKAQLDNGDKPDADLLKRLGDTTNAIAAVIVTPNPLAAPVADASATTDTSVASVQPTQSVASQAAALLSALAGGTATPAADASSGDPLPGLAALTGKLADITKTLAPTDPSTAQLLTALMQKLDAAQTNPQMLGGLTTGGDPTGAGLDASLQKAVSPAPAATAAQQFATAPLAVPEAIVTPKPKDAAPSSQPTTPATTGSTQAPTTPPPTQLKIVAVAQSDASAAPGDKPKDDAKLLATATSAASDAKTATSADTAAAQAAAATSPSTPQAAAVRALPAAYQAAQNPINMGQVAFEMVRQMHQGSSRFSIRLDPAELGRIDVRMHVDASGTVNARLTVERSETLDMFQRDRGSLEKALSQAGLDGSKTNLEFSLKQQNQGQNAFAQMSGGDQRQAFGNSGARAALNGGSDDDSSSIPAITLYRGTASAGGVNLFA